MANLDLFKGGNSPRFEIATVGRARFERDILNTIYAWLVLLVLALAPLPLGSNRPFLWAAWALILGLSLVVYAIGLSISGQNARVRPRDLGISLVLFAAVILYLIVQVLPLGSMIDLSFPTSGGRVSSSQISVSSGDTVLMLLRLMSAGALFFLVAQIAAKETGRLLLLRGIAVLTVAYAIYSIVALYQFEDTILGIEKWAYAGSATGTFVNRNSFATFLAMGLAANVALIGMNFIETERTTSAAPRPGTSLLLQVLGVLIIAAAVVATNSRMGIFVSVASALTVLAGLIGRNAGLRKMMVWWLPAALLIFGAALFLYGDSLWDRLGGTGQDFGGRLTIYKQAMELIAMRPWFGWGGGAFELAFQIVHKAPLTVGVILDRAHNTYLSLWSELGVVFGTLLIAAVTLVAARVAGTSFRSRSGWAAQTACLGAALAGGLHSLVDFSLEIQANTFLFVALLALGFSNRKHSGPVGTSNSGPNCRERIRSTTR